MNFSGVHNMQEFLIANSTGTYIISEIKLCTASLRCLVENSHTKCFHYWLTSDVINQEWVLGA